MATATTKIKLLIRQRQAVKMAMLQELPVLVRLATKIRLEFVVHRVKEGQPLLALGQRLRVDVDNEPALRRAVPRKTLLPPHKLILQLAFVPFCGQAVFAEGQTLRVILSAAPSGDARGCVVESHEDECKSM